MPDLAYTALTTPERLREALLRSNESLDDHVLTPAGDLYDEGLRVIHSVTGTVEKYLDRQLIVRETTQFFFDDEWDRVMAGPEGYDFQLYMDAWPLVQTEEDVFPEGRLLYAPSNLSSLTYFYGYRRPDQGIGIPDSPDEWTEDLTQEPGLGDLTGLPDILPHEIEEVAIKIAMYRLVRQVEGLIGVSERSRSLDNATVQSRKFDFQAQFENRHLRSIRRHRREAV